MIKWIKMYDGTTISKKETDLLSKIFSANYKLAICFAENKTALWS